MPNALINPNVAVDAAIEMVREQFDNEREKNAVIELLLSIKKAYGNYNIPLSVQTVNVFNDEERDDLEYEA